MNRPTTSSHPDDEVYTVSELTRQIKRRLEREWAALWVEGELSNVHPHRSSGHLYFSLKDDRAQIRGIMFQSNASRLRFEPEDGQKVRAFGGLTVYEPQGSYQIRAVRLEPVGVGELELAFRQLYARLEAEGLFDEGSKRPIPVHPRTVGIVTSESGAAIRDLFSVTARRAPHVRLVVRPARVQGPGAAEEIVRAIRELNEWGGADVLIVGRGGGSLEDLWAFNEEIVARAIRDSETPVISAVGHEIDITIADFAADLRAPTPSAAAELAVPDERALRDDLRGRTRRLARALSEALRRRRERVMLLAGSPAFREPLGLVRKRAQDVDRLSDRLETAVSGRLVMSRLRWDGLAGQLGALSPVAILERGYAIVRGADGRVVRRASDVASGDPVQVRLGEGALDCTVERSFVDNEEARATGD
jgi:exodeoxyribonuclease VII large subunit